MIIAIGLTAIALIGWNNDVDADFISRVENTDLLDSEGHSIPRVERNADENVERLELSGMQLSAEDFASIGRLKTLRFLDLYRTNVTNADLRQFRELTHLEGLNLTSTEVSDAAIDEILKLESLRSLCLGNVAISREAVDRLKEHFRAHERRLSLGYSLRK
jgi:Leucine-rich repeat (LRR) protein